jgi:peptidyl-prolyl cis-trans isomerase C
MNQTIRNFAIALGVAAVSLAARAADNDQWVARQGTATLTLADIDANMKDIPEEQRFGFMDSPKRIEETIRNLLLARQLADVARTRGIQDSAEFKQRMKLVEDRLLAAELIDRMKSEVKVGDLEQIAKETYAAKPANFREPDSYDLQHILISVGNHSPAEARALAIDLRGRILKGEDFTALAQKYSEDPGTREHGGTLNGINATMKLEPNFLEAIQGLSKDGALSDVVQTRLGYHVIRLNHRTAGRQKTFAEVRPQILENLKAERVQAAIKDYTDNMRSVALDADPDTVASLRTRYSPQPVPPATSAPNPGK